MTDQNNTSGVTPEQAAGAANGFSTIRKYTDIVALAAVNPEEVENPHIRAEIENSKQILEIMDSKMAPFALDPAGTGQDTMELVFDLDQDLQDAVDKMIEDYKNFHERNAARFRELRSPLDKATAIGQEFKLLHEESKKLASSLAKAPITAAKGLVKGVNALFKKINGTKDAPDSPEQALTKMLNERIPKLNIQVSECAVAITKAGSEFELLEKEMSDLRNNIIYSNDMLGVLIGVSEELIRRYREEYIPELQSAIDDTRKAGIGTTVVMEANLGNMTEICARLIKKHDQMNQRYASRTMQMQMLDDQVRSINNLKLELRSLKSAPTDWRMALNTAAMAVQLANAGDFVDALQKMNTETLETAVDAHIHGRNLAVKAAEHQPLEAQKLEASAGRLIAAANDFTKREADVTKAIEAQTARTQQTIGNLIDAADARQEARTQAQIEAAEGVKGKAAAIKQIGSGKPVNKQAPQSGAAKPGVGNNPFMKK